VRIIIRKRLIFVEEGGVERLTDSKSAVQLIKEYEKKGYKLINAVIPFGGLVIYNLEKSKENSGSR
jgi:hypothetical protein